MSREIKFRAWDNSKKAWKGLWIFRGGHAKEYDVSKSEIDILSLSNRWGSDVILEQFTGKYGYNKKELYEGDIVFYEEPEEDGDKRYYLVIVWIPEWSMFASLHMEEYLEYLQHGAEVLDEPLFWTYTLRQSEHYHYAGTIHQNSELLKQ